MSKSPILVIQMQRMGDFVLTFPLLAWLHSYYPDHPVWVIGEEHFFTPLMPLSPPATYFAFGDTTSLKNHTFHAVINLSHRKEAAVLAGSLKSHVMFGATYTDISGFHIHGDWQLYRASLTHNNRYNYFHWADLNGLGIVSPEVIKRSIWPTPRPFPKNSDAARVGLFLGASETAKHPSSTFWAALTKQLLHNGFRPVLLGGKAEKSLGKEVAQKVGAPQLDLCGRFDIHNLCKFIGELNLLVTSDTGPMHLATWTGTPVFNLSMGPVNPWETGPFSPQHHVMRANVPCLGCWECTENSLLCKELFVPRHVAQVIIKLFAETLNKDDLQNMSMAEKTLLFRTAKNSYGLSTLTPANDIPLHNLHATQTHLFAQFWQAWFGTIFGVYAEKDVTQAWENIQQSQPYAELFANAAKKHLLAIAGTVKKAPQNFLADGELWKQSPSVMRPLSSYSQLFIQNNNAKKEALLHALSLAEYLCSKII